MLFVNSWLDGFFLFIIIAKGFPVLVLCSRSGAIPAWNESGDRLALYLGIIDILQSYRFKKKLEHAFKSLITDGVCFFLLLLFCYYYYII